MVVLVGSPSTSTSVFVSSGSNVYEWSFLLSPFLVFAPTGLGTSLAAFLSLDPL